MTARLFLILALCTVAFSAYAADDVDVAVMNHDIARGDVITANDLTTKSIPVVMAGNGLIRSGADAIGKEARRALRAGELIRESDLKRPTLITKGAAVTMVFDSAGMHLTAMGKALAEGGQGDSIAVLNPTSYRQVVGVVIGPGTVQVNSQSLAIDQIAQSQP
jgi:flagella basal body P-ring formation protein FlgA